jgi:hypothetical protein
MVILASTSMLAIFCGIVCNNDPELAWRLYEWDCRQISINPPQWADWRSKVKLVGYGLMGLGLLGLMVGLGIL